MTDDAYNSEVTWRLTCDGLSIPITGGAPYLELHEVPQGSCALILMDSYGDGWQGATWTAPGWTDQSYTLVQGSWNNVSFYARRPTTVLTTNGATCGVGLEITSLADCSAAIAAANTAIGTAGYGTVSSVSYSFDPKGCYSSCYSDYTGYFCGRFNTHATGSGLGTDTGNNRYLHCALPLGTTPVAVTSPPPSPAAPVAVMSPPPSPAAPVAVAPPPAAAAAAIEARRLVVLVPSKSLTLPLTVMVSTTAVDDGSDGGGGGGEGDGGGGEGEGGGGDGGGGEGGGGDGGGGDGGGGDGGGGEGGGGDGGGGEGVGRTA